MLHRQGIAAHAWRLICFLRPDTFRALSNRIKVERHASRRPPPLTAPVRIQPPDINQLVTKKLQAIRTHTADSRYTIPLNEVEKRALFPDGATLSSDLLTLLKNFESYVDNLLQRHAALIVAAGFPFPSANAVLSIAYNDNVRSFSRNCIRGLALALSYLDQAQTRSDIPFFRADVPRLEFEASVLGGNPYFVHNLDDDIKGRWCPNLFDFDRVGDDGRWDGLALLRVLQFLPLSGNTRAAPSLTRVCKVLTDLGYPEGQIRISLYAGLDFGLVRIRDHDGDGNPLYEKTRKGAYIERLPFIDASVLYLMATGSRLYSLPEWSGTDQRRAAGWLHDLRSPRKFWSAALRSGTELLRHIKYAHERDLNHMRSTRTAGSDEIPASTWQIADADIDNLIRQLAQSAFDSLTGPDPSNSNAVKAVLLDWAERDGISIAFSSMV